jgi:hypothetical protein
LERQFRLLQPVLAAPPVNPQRRRINATTLGKHSIADQTASQDQKSKYLT